MILRPRAAVKSPSSDTRGSSVPKMETRTHGGPEIVDECWNRAISARTRRRSAPAHARVPPAQEGRGSAYGIRSGTRLRAERARSLSRAPPTDSNLRAGAQPDTPLVRVRRPPLSRASQSPETESLPTPWRSKLGGSCAQGAERTLRCSGDLGAVWGFAPSLRLLRRQCSERLRSCRRTAPEGHHHPRRDGHEGALSALATESLPFAIGAPASFSV